MNVQSIQSLTTLLHNVKGLLRPAVFSLLAVALLTSNASAAVIQSNMTPEKAQQFVRETLVSVKPALHASVGDALPESLLTMVNAGTITPATANKYRLIFVEGKAPEGMPEIAHVLSLSKDERFKYSMQQLQEAGLLSSTEVQFFTDLRAAPDEEVRDIAVAALESGSFGTLASAILKVVVDLSSIDPNADLQTCEASSSGLAAQGWLGNALKWLGGLVKSILDGAADGALFGLLFGGGVRGAAIGAVIGGIAGGVKYISDTTGNGFMAGPNGEDCTAWPKPFPGF